jgi:abhydrolase domain-containing protein 6
LTIHRVLKFFYRALKVQLEELEMSEGTNHVEAASAPSYIDILKEGILEVAHEIDRKVLKNWKPSKLTVSVRSQIHSYVMNMERRSTYVKSQKIVWFEGGNPNGEPVLLLHGFASNKENWILMMPFLLKRYRVFIPDLPGWGESLFEVDEPYHIIEQIKRIHFWAEKYLPDEFHVVGSSMGGGVAALLTIYYPEKILSLTLMNALGAFGAEQTDFEKELRKGRNHLIPSHLTGVVQMMSTVTSYNRWALSAILAPVMYQDLISRRHVNQHLFQQLLSNASSDTFAGLVNIKVPTFVFWGEDDQILHSSCAMEFKRLIPHAEVKILRGAGHLPMVEMPGVTARALRKFWINASNQRSITVKTKPEMNLRVRKVNSSIVQNEQVNVTYI